MPTRNQVEGPPIRTAPSAAAVAGTKTGRKQPRTQEQSTPVQPIDLNPLRISPKAGNVRIKQKVKPHQLQPSIPGHVKKNSKLGKAAASAGATPSLGHSLGPATALRSQIMLAMVSEAVRVAPPPGTEMRSIPKSSVRYLHRSTRSTRNVSPLYDDDLVPYLEATNKTPDLTYLRKLKKGNTLGIGPSLLGPDAGKGLFAGSKANPAYRNSSYSGSAFKQGARIDQYKGVRIGAKVTEGRFVSIQEQIIASTSKYIWQDDKDTDFAVDAEKPSS